MEALATLAAAGFDIAHSFDAAAAGASGGVEIGWDGFAGTARLGVLIGNTRALWSPFTAALAEPALAADPDPLDRYTERVIDSAFGTTATHIYYAHRRYHGGFVPIQRLAAASGFGALAPNHLVIHPEYGPWFALRAVVILDGDPPVSAAIAKPCQCDASCDAAFAQACRSGDWRDWLAVRDSCALRSWRYSDEQIRFHYSRLCQLVT